MIDHWNLSCTSPSAGQIEYPARCLTPEGTKMQYAIGPVFEDGWSGILIDIWPLLAVLLLLLGLLLWLLVLLVKRVRRE